MSYIRIDELPEPGDYMPIVAAIENGDYFVTSGEVVIPSHSYEGTASAMTLVADVAWTFTAQGP